MGSGPRAWRPLRAFLIVVTSCFLLCFQTYAQNSSAQSEITPPQPVHDQLPGEISGHVYRADTGEPIAGASVTLRSTQIRDIENYLQVPTAADGSFAFSEVAPGTYIASASATGFLGQSYGPGPRRGIPRTIFLSAGQKIENIDIRLLAEGIISGTVFDEDNKPVKDVSVVALSVRYRPGGRQYEIISGASSSDDLGNFQIFALRPGSYFVRAGGWRVNPKRAFSFRESYYPGTTSLKDAQAIEVTSAGETSGIRLRVTNEPAYTISGTIKDPGATGKVPPRRYDIEIARRGELRRDIAPFDASSETSFSKGGLPAGDYIVAVTAFDSAPTEEGWAISGAGYAHVQLVDTDAHVNVEIGNGAEVRGKVSVEGSQSLSVIGHYINLVPIESAWAWANGVPIDQNGGFDIRDIPPGRYFFAFSPEVGYQKAQCSGVDYTIEPPELDLGTVMADCEIILTAGTATLSGQVVEGKRPVAGVAVVLIPEAQELRHFERYTLATQTRPNGQFQISGIIPGEYLLFAVPQSDDESYYAPDFANRNRRNAQPVSLKASETQVINLNPSTPQ